MLLPACTAPQQPALLELFEKYKDSKGMQAKLKTPNQLQDLLDITRDLIQKLQAADSGKDEAATAAGAAAGSNAGSEKDKDELVGGGWECGCR